ncbi:MAG: pilus assembly PilX N-terminal domain-containing protein [Candidatus Eremiobacterota bacterium]
MLKKISKRIKKGSVLMAALIMMLVLSIIGWAFVSIIIALNNQTQASNLSKQAYYCADAGIERCAMKLWNNFTSYGMVDNKIKSFKNFVDDNESPSIFVPETPLGNGGYTVTIERVGDPNSFTETTVRLTSIGYSRLGTSKAIERRIVADIRFYLAGTPLMDFAYFGNNFAWMQGGVRTGGSVASNGLAKIWKDGGTPLITGGDRYENCFYKNSHYDINKKIDDGGLYAASGFASGLAYQGLADTRPIKPDLHGPNSPSKFERISMPSLANSGYYKNYAKECEANAASSNKKYGIYVWVAGGTQLRNNDGTIMTAAHDPDNGANIDNNGKIKTGGAYIKVSDAVYGDDINGNLKSTGYFLNGTDWVKGERENIILDSGTSSHPMEIYGTVVVEDNVAIEGTVKGSGTIYAGNNIYVTDSIEYSRKPTLPSGGNVNDGAYRGFVKANDGDNHNPGTTASGVSVTQAEINQQNWLDSNKPAPADETGKDLLGLFPNGNLLLGNVQSSSGNARAAIKDNLTILDDLPVAGLPGNKEYNVNLNETDEARLGEDQVPNTRTSTTDSEYTLEKNNHWDVSFYTPSNPPPTDPNDSSQYAYIPNSDPPTRYECLTEAEAQATPSGDYSSWSSKYKNAVIPGSGEDLNGDGRYTPALDQFNVCAFNTADADYLRSNNTSTNWANRMKFDPNAWGGTHNISSGNVQFKDISADGVLRLDAISYTNNLWGGYTKLVNGGLVTRVEATRMYSGGIISHDDRVVGGGQSITDTSLGTIVPQIEHMEIVSWKE